MNNQNPSQTKLSYIFIIAILLLFIGLAGYFFAQNNPSQDQQTNIAETVELSPTEPTPQDILPQDKIQERIVEGAQAREAGEYEEAEEAFRQALASAQVHEDDQMTIEAVNNLSIQLRLAAGKANREGDTETAEEYADESVELYDLLTAEGLFDETDPGIARNWAHALLYAGDIEGAITALDESIEVQTLPAAQGDEQCHKASALVEQGELEEAEVLVEQGTELIETNDGSPVWLTYCYMTEASLYAQEGDEAQAQAALDEALAIAQENNLSIREEEIQYLQEQPVEEINVLSAVGVTN